MIGWWKIANPLESNPVGQVMTWNLRLGQQISCHDTSDSIFKALDPTDWGMVQLAELEGCKDGEKLQIHWNPIQWGRSWHEICALGQQISCHGSSVSTLETSDPTHLGMTCRMELDRPIDGGKLQIQCKPIQWGSSWREIWAPDHKFHIVTPLRAPWRPSIKLIRAWCIEWRWIAQWW